ncbi:zinc ABC transporter substrate-binding protein [Aliiroseovarius sp. 2305UL8-7]|uniref:zinc ABC transporter substrate-binding protein n=1 Tax=Aliiroseovarius conchicola TaxID=3121637 RepID=UPI003527A5C4
MIRSSLLALLFSTTTAMADAPKVVTDFAPVQSLVAQVMDGVATPDVLLPQEADPHAFQMRPSQARTLAQADMVFWVGPELTPWLDRALDGLGDAKAVALLDMPGTNLRESDHVHGHEDHDDEAHHDDAHDTHEDKHEDGHETEHEHEHEHEQHEDVHDEDHNHDPHAWLSPDNAAIWLTAIAERLAEQDPEHAETYRANAAQARERLIQLDKNLVSQLKPVQDRGFIVFHDAYGYLVDHFGLTQKGALREGDNAAPSAARLSELQALLANGEVVCAFAEAAVGGEMLETLSQGTGTALGVLDPIGTTVPVGPDLYEQMMRKNVDAIVDCLQ